MAVLDILQIGNPILRQHSSKITRFDKGLSRLADDMVETMQAANGVGLAAPQVGISARLIVVEMPESEDYPHPGERWVMCNPEIVKASRETEVAQEGCLSVVGYVGEVERPVDVTVRGLDLQGRKMRVKAEGYLARAFQHEIDHLNGVLYVDIAEEDTVMTVEEFQEMMQEAEDQDEPTNELVTLT
ncbi:MAG: peptide deformylase [Anaerolineae bacterium]